jgi:hypothetical protein
MSMPVISRPLLCVLTTIDACRSKTNEVSLVRMVKREWIFLNGVSNSASANETAGGAGAETGRMGTNLRSRCGGGGGEGAAGGDGMGRDGAGGGAGADFLLLRGELMQNQ